MSTKLGDITLTKQSGTRLTLNTQGTYVPDDKYFDIAVRSGVGTVTIASTDAAVLSDETNRNVSGIFGTKSTSAPSSGYYLKVSATGNGSSTITTAGWLEAGNLGTATATGSFYFPVTEAAAAITGTNVVTPSASLSGNNVTFSNTNNGISVTATGGGSATASVTATSFQAGYVANNTTLDTTTVAASSATTTDVLYISGVTISIPTSGKNVFTVTLPNGSGDTVDFVFEVDASGNTTITSNDS